MHEVQSDSSPSHSAAKHMVFTGLAIEDAVDVSCCGYFDLYKFYSALFIQLLLVPFNVSMIARNSDSGRIAPASWSNTRMLAECYLVAESLSWMCLSTFATTMHILYCTNDAKGGAMDKH